MTCINQGGFFKRKGYSLLSRILLFYIVCIPIRILLGVALWFLLQENIKENIKELYNTILSLIIIISFFSTITLISCINDTKVWWNRKFELCIAILMILLSSLTLANQMDGKYLALPIWIDAAFGLICSFFIYF